MSDQFVVFTIQCKVCGQRLAPARGDGSVIYSHENASDCANGNEVVEMPEVSPEQVAALFKSKKKVATKKTAKK